MREVAQDAEEFAPSQRQDLEAYLNSLTHTWLRWLTLAPIVLNPLFLSLDYMLMPASLRDAFPKFMAARLLMLVLCVALYIVLRRVRPSGRSFAYGYALSVFCSSPVQAMIVWLGGFGTGYYAGLNLVITGLGTVMPWKPRHSVANGLMMTATYLALNAVVFPAEKIDTGAGVMAVYFLLSNTVLVALANWVRFSLIVRDFKTRQQLQDRDDELQADLQQARDFQARLIHLPAPNAAEAVAFSLAYQPTSVIGGDLVDVAKLSDQRYRVLLVDVAGHGVQACMRAMELLRHYERWRTADAPPWEILRWLNDHVVNTYGELSLLYTACCLELTYADAWRLRYSNAGQPPFVLRGPSDVEWVDAPGPYQGASLDMAASQFECAAATGTRLYLYTDGFCPDRPSKDAPWLQLKTLEDCTAAALQVALVQNKISGEDDDVTLLGIELNTGMPGARP